MPTTNASIWTSGIASLAPEDILRLMQISDTYIKSSVVARRDAQTDKAVYALGVSNLYELHKAISANVLVIHINPDCSSLIQEQRRRLRDIRIRRKIEWITILGVFSSVFISHWVKHQRLLGGQRYRQVSLIQDLKALFSSPPATQHGLNATIETRLPASIIMSMEGFRKDPPAVDGRAAHINRRNGMCWISVLSPLWKDRSSVLLTSALVASIAFHKRSRRGYELIKTVSTDRETPKPEYFLIRQDALCIKQTAMQQSLDKLPLLVAAITSTILIRRCFLPTSA